MEVVEKLKRLGEEICTQIERGEYPFLDLPSRTTNNIVYDPERGRFTLGEAKIRRSTSNLKHLRSFTQTVWVAWIAKRLVEEGKTATLRDIYYLAESYKVKFKDQQESDSIVADLEALLGVPREKLGIFPEERATVYGDLTIRYNMPGYEEHTLKLTASPDGVAIGPALTNATFEDCGAEKVVMVESGGMFTRLIEEKAHEKFKAILIHTAGQAPRSARQFAYRLNRELNLPVYIFTDGDPWGAHIAMVVISGSANAAHIDDVAIPGARWIGILPADIEEYRLPSEKFNEKDWKRLGELTADPRYQSPFWREQLRKFEETGRKAEQQALSAHGLSYVTEKYLPEKIS
nr:DNA topoisomerase IV subunit A [Candidatus Freyrarchaeum guaymaensis]